MSNEIKWFEVYITPNKLIKTLSKEIEMLEKDLKKIHSQYTRQILEEHLYTLETKRAILHTLVIQIKFNGYDIWRDYNLYGKGLTKKQFKKLERKLRIWNDFIVYDCSEYGCHFSFKLAGKTLYYWNIKEIKHKRYKYCIVAINIITGRSSTHFIKTHKDIETYLNKFFTHIIGTTKTILNQYFYKKTRGIVKIV